LREKNNLFAFRDIQKSKYKEKTKKK